MPRPVDSRTTYIPALDGLRTIAVMAVVVYHLNSEWIPGGLLGVAVFFTLSGYLISTNLLRAKQKHGSFNLRTFWLRRFRRLAPAMLLTVAAVLLVTALISPGEMLSRLGEAASSVLYVNNWYVIFQEKSYFDQFAGLGPLDHMWSLSIEEQFYLVWPLVLAVLFLAFGRLARARVVIATMTVLLALASFGLMHVLSITGADATRIYEGTDTRAGGLLLGAVLAIALMASSGTPTRRVAEISTGVGITVILVLMVLLPDHSPFLFSGGLLVLSLTTMAVIYGITTGGTVIGRVLEVAPMRWIGERSYGIYLWHLPVIVFLPEQLNENPLVRSLVVIGLSFFLAALSWTLVEDPIRHHGVIEPVRNWVRSTRAARRERLPGPGIPRTVLAGATVVLVSVSLMAIPRTVTGDTVLVAQDQTMEIDAAAVDKDALADAKQNAGPAETSCTTVVHVGDSTSIGMFADSQLPDPSDNAVLRYLEVGAEDVVTSVFGARATAEGWESYPSAVASVTELMSQGMPDGTCWVIATGVNDAANEAVGHGYPHPDRVAAMLEVLEGEQILWATAWSGLSTGPWATDNMKPFNDALREAMDDNPNLYLFEWAKDAQDNWFLESDFIHYNSTGNAERSARFADAVAQAFPAQGDGPKDRTVSSADREIKTSKD